MSRSRNREETVVESDNDIDESLNKLPQDHPQIIEVLQDYFISKPNKNYKRNIQPQSFDSLNYPVGLLSSSCKSIVDG